MILVTLKEERTMRKFAGHMYVVVMSIILAFPSCAIPPDEKIPIPQALKEISESSPSFEIEISDIASLDSSALIMEENGVNLLWTVGKTQEGAKMLEEAIAVEPRLVIAPVNLAWYYVSFLSDTDAAYLVLENAIKYHPNQTHLYFYLANTLAAADDHDRAIIMYLRALELGFKYTSVYYNLGNSYKRTGNLEAAISSYFDALEYDSTHINARNMLVSSFIEKGDVDNALRYAGSDADRFKRMAITFGREGYLEAALQASDRALELDPNDAETHYNRGASLRLLERNAEAVESYRRAVSLDSDSFHYHGYLASSLRKLGRNEDALASIDNSIELEPDGAGVHFERGLILVLLDRYDDAIAAFTRTLELEPDHPQSKKLIEAIRAVVADQKKMSRTQKNFLGLNIWLRYR